MQFDENEQEPITTPDTENRTRINPQEASDPVLDKNGRNKWERLSGINTGVVDSFGNSDTSKQKRQDRAAAFDIMADHLKLSDVYQREGRELMMDSIDTKTLSRPGSDVYIVCFCLAANLINRDNIPRSYHPARRDIDNDQHFVRVSKEFDFDTDMINSLMQKVSHYV